MSGEPLLSSGMITAAVSIRKANRRGIKPVALPLILTWYSLISLTCYSLISRFSISHKQCCAPTW
jgi:hypothetical protein